MRRGLPLAPPHRRNSDVARRSPVSPSPYPPLKNTIGTIAVFKTDNTLLGYISHAYDGVDSFVTTSDPTKAQLFQLPSTTPYYGAFDIITSSPEIDSVHPYLGAGAGPYADVLGTGSAGYAIFTGTTHVPANSPPSTSGSSSKGTSDPAIESQIWSIDGNTLELTAQWTNPDGSQPTTILYSDVVFGFVGLTDDLATYNSQFGEPGIQVFFYFVPS